MVVAVVVSSTVAWSYGEGVRVQCWRSRDGRLMTRIIENGFIVNIFFFEEWTASFFVNRLGWWTRVGFDPDAAIATLCSMKRALQLLTLRVN